MPVNTRLSPITQETFARGVVRDVARHLIPVDGVYDLVNMLLDDGGSAYRRAGSIYKSTVTDASSVVSHVIRCLWDGLLMPGQRTFFCVKTGNGANDGFFALGADDTTPVGNLGVGAGLPNGPVRFKEHRGVLYGQGFGMYGGSRKTVGYTTGTVAVTNGSTLVTGTGTTWTTNVDVGMLLRVAGSSAWYVVAAVVSNTQLTLKETYKQATASGQAYSAQPIAQQSSVGLPAVAAPTNFSGTPLYWASVAGRLVVSDGSARVFFSGINDPTTFGVNDWWEIPGGVNVIGLEPWRDQLLIFTTRGVWSLSNLHLALTDPAGNVQQRIALVHDDVTLLGDAGVAAYQQQVVVPTLHGVFLIDGQGGTVGVSTNYMGSLNQLYLSYVRGGYKPGAAAIYEGHYFLPILAGDTVIDLLVARLDRPVYSWRGRRAIAAYPWTRFAGAGGSILCFAARSAPSARPTLLAGGTQATNQGSRLLETRYMEPSNATDFDHDGTAPAWALETRDFLTGLAPGAPGEGTENLVRRARLHYEMSDPTQLAPTYGARGSLRPQPTGSPLPGAGAISAAYSVGASAASSGNLWGAFNWGTGQWTDSTSGVLTQLSGQAPSDDGRRPFTWLLGPDGGGIRGRVLRMRFSAAGAVDSLTIRGLMLFVRPTRRLR